MVSRRRARFNVVLTRVSREDEWLWGWDPTPGIVSVWAEPDGSAWIWRRDAHDRAALSAEQARFRPWVVLDRLDDLAHLGRHLGPHDSTAPVRWRELDGPGELRFLVDAPDARGLHDAIATGASRRLDRRIGHLRDLGPAAALVLPIEEQYLVASGRVYFRDLPFAALRRLQLDLETTGLDPATDRIFLAAVRDPDGATTLLEAPTAADEPDLLRAIAAAVAAADPDVIENHNLHGFDLGFLDVRARQLRVPLVLGRRGPPPPAGGCDLRRRAARRGIARAGQLPVRLTVPGRELIDTLDAVRRHDFSARDLPGHDLKSVARHYGLAAADRAYVPGAEVHATYQRDPARVRHYASDDVAEVEGLARLLGGAAFALARMAPRRYERLADAGAATGVIDPLLVRAYLRAGAALPAHAPGDGTTHDGAALHLFAAGVARRIVKADVASLYPSLMRTYRIGPARDRLGALLALVDHLLELRLAAKAAARAAPRGSTEHHTHDAVSAAIKLVINSAYGYLAAGGLTRFADVHAANEVTRRGREVLALMCRELAARGVTLIEADTDGVYFSVPPAWTADDERRVVDEVAALLPARVRLELEGRYAAMLSHEPKNYALRPYAGPLVLRGVAFRSSRAEPFGERFLRAAVDRLLDDDIAGVQTTYVAAVLALRRRALPVADVAARVRLTKSPAEYLAVRASRRELPYEAMLGAGRTTWTPGERVRVYRASHGRAGLLATAPTDAAPARPDYDADHYVRVLRDTFAARLARALTPDDFAAVFADPEQPSLFAPKLSEIRTVLREIPVSSTAARPSDTETAP